MMVVKYFVFAVMLSLSASVLANSDAYRDAVSSWQSHEDVGRWLESHFVFDTSRQKAIQSRLKSQGPSGLLVRSPDKLFTEKKGYCADSANFALNALNEIDPAYNPRWVFVKNAAGSPNHWVTAFDYEGKTYVMDFGAGKKWKAMNGVHGPYDSLSEYRDFLASLNLRGFKVGDVRYRDMPGVED